MDSDRRQRNVNLRSQWKCQAASASLRGAARLCCVPGRAPWGPVVALAARAAKQKSPSETGAEAKSKTGDSDPYSGRMRCGSQLRCLPARLIIFLAEHLSSFQIDKVPPATPRFGNLYGFFRNSGATRIAFEALHRRKAILGGKPSYEAHYSPTPWTFGESVCHLLFPNLRQANRSLRAPTA